MLEILRSFEKIGAVKIGETEIKRTVIGRKSKARVGACLEDENSKGKQETTEDRIIGEESSWIAYSRQHKYIT